jgi:beta-glucosidase
MVLAQTVTPSREEVAKRVNALLAKMTLEEKIDYIGGENNMFIRAVPRLGIPRLKMSDGPMGVRTWGKTTAYPAGIATAASWDTDLAKRIGVALGQDARARGVHFVLEPGMNIYRAPMCGRNFEYFGEDPYLASRMAVANIEGVQSQGVIATAKHFVANNQEWDRHNVSSDVDERTLREIYLPAFEASVKEAKVGAIMDSYNLINGVHATQNAFLNIELARKEWGFGGIVMSDWDATYDAVGAANGGLDLEMPYAKFMKRALLEPAIQEGKVSEATIDEKVRHILTTAMEFGFFDRDQTLKNIPLDNPNGREVALEAARGSMVLLKNEGSLLPLDKSKLKSIAVIGPNAARAVTGGSGSSEAFPFSAVSFLDGIRKETGGKIEVATSSGIMMPEEAAEATEFFADEARKEPGLKGEYFDSMQMSGMPALTRVDGHIDFHYGQDGYREGGPNRFSVRWTGYYVPAATGQYKLYVRGENGYRVFVDGKLVAQKQRTQLETLPAATLPLEGGKAYPIRLEYFKVHDGGRIALGITPENDGAAERAKAAAAKADVVVLCIGFDAATEGEGRDRTFALPPGQDELIRTILGANRRTLVVLTAGGAVDMTRWIDDTPALIDVWYPGEEGGTALAQILFGEYSPSGKLPASFERRWEDNATFYSYYDTNNSKHVAYTEGVFLGYRHFDRSSTKPLFPFGYGLSYTTFHYGNLRVEPAPAGGDALALVSFQVKNTGTRAGAEVAQLYVGDTHSHVARPVKELKGFAKVNLKPGETKTVRLTLNRRSFSYWDAKQHQWTAEPGEFAILVGSSSAKIELQGSFKLAK